MSPLKVYCATAYVGMAALCLFPPRAAYTDLIGSGRGYAPTVEGYRGHVGFWRPAETSHFGDAHTIVAVSPGLLAMEALGVNALALFAAGLARQLGTRAANASVPAPRPARTRP